MHGIHGVNYASLVYRISLQSPESHEGLFDDGLREFVEQELQLGNINRLNQMFVEPGLKSFVAIGGLPEPGERYQKNPGAIWSLTNLAS